ncbi:unknown [Firmicutes bacterium CAG:83]|nr:unknown [Firmicutes bacterium CAG:83]
MTFSSWLASAEKAMPLLWISCATSEMFRAWSEMRSKSEMVCRYLDTSSL